MSLPLQGLHSGCKESAVGPVRKKAAVHTCTLKDDLVDIREILPGGLVGFVPVLASGENPVVPDGVDLFLGIAHSTQHRAWEDMVDFGCIAFVLDLGASESLYQMKRKVVVRL